MAVLRIRVSKLLLISYLFGFMANNVNGATSSVPTQAYTTGWASTAAPVTCPRPTFTNPYAIELDPDQPTYTNNYYLLKLTCEEGHTPSGLPSPIYCYPDGTWQTDPYTGGLCYAQCNTTELIVDDDIKATDNNGSVKTVFDHGTTAKFECTDKGQFSGTDEATCSNGTLDLTFEPACLAYCPISLQELGEGLYYDIADEPVINETNTFYYRDKDEVTYRCLDGYEGPISISCTSSDCRSTCDDGTWDPPNIPTCVENYECDSGPCKNNGTCTDLINEYTCQCVDGFNGTNCENDINDCVNNDCKNGATCLDKVNSYECQCPDGYNGTFCGNNIDECSPDPCQHDGTCTDLVNGFNCTCAPGYVGDTCDQVITTSAMTNTIMTAMPDQTTIAATSLKAFTTDAITTSPLPTPHLTTLMASTDSSGGTTRAAPTPSDSPTSLPETTETEHVRSTSVTTKPTEKPKTSRPTTPQKTEPPTTPDVWKVVVGVTVPIVSILIITAVCFLCWQHRRLDQTSPASASTQMKTYRYEDETDAEARPYLAVR